jgi:hypothetical protein
VIIFEKDVSEQMLESRVTSFRIMAFEIDFDECTGLLVSAQLQVSGNDPADKITRFVCASS